MVRIRKAKPAKPKRPRYERKFNCSLDHKAAAFARLLLKTKTVAQVAVIVKARPRTIYRLKNLETYKATPCAKRK